MNSLSDKNWSFPDPNDRKRPLRALNYAVLRGSNCYLPKTAISHEFDLGDLAELSNQSLGRAFIKEFIERFQALEIMATDCFSEAFVDRLNSEQGVPVSELLLEAILTLESAVAYQMRNTDYAGVGMVVNAANGEVRQLVWECTVKRMSRQSALLACRGINELLPAGFDLARQPAGDSFTVGLRKLLNAARRRRRPLNAAALMESARRRNMPCEIIANSYLALGQGIAQHLIHSSYNGNTSEAIAQFDNSARAARIAYPDFVLPLTDLPDIPQREGDILHRLLVVDNRLIGALRIQPPVLTGDGSSSVSDLLKQHNHAAGKRGITQFAVAHNAELEDLLRKEKLKIDSVIGAGRQLVLSYIECIEKGALHFDVTDELHTDYCEAALTATIRRRLHCAAIDIYASDITCPTGRRRVRITQVNPNAALWPYAWPYAGASRDAAAGILDTLSEPGFSGRVPLLMVYGQHGADRVARAAEHMLRNSGALTALALKRQSFINGKVVRHESSVRRNAVRDLLNRHQTELLVGTASFPTIIRQGLGVDQIEVAAILDPEPGQQEDEYRLAVEVLLKSTSGFFVVSSENHIAHEVLAHVPRNRIILVSHDLRNSYLEKQRRDVGLALIEVEQHDQNLVAITEGGVIVAAEPLAYKPAHEGKKSASSIDYMFSLALAYAAGLRQPQTEVDGPDELGITLISAWSTM